MWFRIDLLQLCSRLDGAIAVSGKDPAPARSRVQGSSERHGRMRKANSEKWLAAVAKFKPLPSAFRSPDTVRGEATQPYERTDRAVGFRILIALSKCPKVGSAGGDAAACAEEKAS